jgi:hypothetical protein
MIQVFTRRKSAYWSSNWWQPERSRDLLRNLPRFEEMIAALEDEGKKGKDAYLGSSVPETTNGRYCFAFCV